jgi:hypothetical protein
MNYILVVRKILIALLLAAGVVAADPRLEVISVQRIWAEAPHSAFGDIIRFQDRWPSLPGSARSSFSTSIYGESAHRLDGRRAAHRDPAGGNGCRLQHHRDGQERRRIPALHVVLDHAAQR